MNYDLTIEYKDGRASMRFLGIDFLALDKVFGTMPIKRLSNYCFGIFNPKQEEPIYIQSSDDNIAEIISVPITNLHSLIEFFRNIPDSMPAGIKNVLLVDASIVRQTGILQNQERT